MNRHTAGRTGKSLIEMIVVIAGISVVIATAGQLLHRVAQSERQIRNAAAVGRAQLRLARIFRQDVRSADSVEPFAGEFGEGMRLLLDGSTVEYDFRDGVVVRTVTGEPASHEGYRLGSVAVHFHRDGERFAVLSVDPQRAVGRPQATAGRFRIIAAIGADVSGHSNRQRTADSPRPPVEASRPEAEESS